MLLLLVALAVLGLSIKAASAATQLARLPQVAVLDFDALPRVKHADILKREATAAFIARLTTTHQYAVLSRTVVYRALSDDHLSLPLGNGSARKLGQRLGNDFVAYGTIVDVRFTNNPRRAKVTLDVRFIDVFTGELANGVIETGISSIAKQGSRPDDRKLVSDALQQAVSNVIGTITSYTLPPVTVLHNRLGKEIVLDRGALDNIEPGMEMMIFHGRVYVGHVRVKTVRPRRSIAVIIGGGKGIHRWDQARVLFRLTQCF